MMIRAFLFLLAMLTGVTAANAAGNAHISPSSIGAMAQTNAVQVGPSILVGEVDRNLSGRYPAARSTLASKKCGYFFVDQATVAPCIFRSDRTRQ
jgi:hypothetical protein